MAKVRIGIATAFELENELVGIGTDNPTNTLQALGNIHATNTKAVGVSTFAAFDGFVDTKARIEGAGGAKSGATSGEIIIEGEVTVSTGTTFTSGPENLTVKDDFTLPGISDDRPTVGTMRFNENLASLEFYTGVEWRAVNSYVDNGNRGRAIFFGGYDTNPHGDAYGKHIDYMSLVSGGKALNFGDLYQKRTNTAACGNTVRSLCTRGYSIGDDLDYVNIASTGDGIDFGDMTIDTYGGQGVSSSTRGIFVGGAGTNVIDYVEIMTTGNGIDFGDAGVRSYYRAALQSPTRAVLAGGYGNYGDQMAYASGMITFMMASKGNSTGWGDTTDAYHDNVNGGSNHVRGVYALGADNASPYDGETAIDYTTLASGGNATSFGDLTHHVNRPGASASNIRVVIAGGRIVEGGSTTGKYSEIDSIVIASTGGGTSFGELSLARDQFGGTSDCHGGLGGF